MSSKEGGFRKRKHDSFPHGHKEENDSINFSSSIMTSFKMFQLELDTRHDKYERLVKLSRDITIESKRTIFLLHRITSASNVEEILAESEVKLDLVRQKIKQVAQELMGEDMHQYHRAISPGLQEYVEAVSFQYFIKTRSLISLEDINRQLIFKEVNKEEERKPSSDSPNNQNDTWNIKVTPVDYLLGVADLTGELMRMCINSSPGTGREKEKATSLGSGCEQKGLFLSSLGGGRLDGAASTPAFGCRPGPSRRLQRMRVGWPGAGKGLRPNLGWLERTSCTTSAEPERSSSAPQLGQDETDLTLGENLGFPGVVKRKQVGRKSHRCLEPRQVRVGNEIASCPGDPAVFLGPLLAPPVGAAPPLSRGCVNS
ncbi:translin-associated protein X [Crotalus adamanteus]|uniref:Translin-associated protein X n=1 Tax=Crotalus adamanteus TaxID=8729 RepID=A0AAW1CCI2_CROAD